ncbi:class I SAM-dependent methyltransferase [Candidatus Falkowbacteria bacterium]|nr:class I SAM-dependent methyltransferase [Candidatus Falkowbacteria bacterium]
MVNVQKCPACFSKDVKKVFTEFGLSVLGCDACGHLFSLSPVDQDYDGYFGKEVGLDAVQTAAQAHDKLFDDFLSNVLPKKNTGKLLDVGCGYGFFVKTMLEKTAWQVWGVETSPVAVMIAEKELGLKTVVHGAVETAELPKPFDVVTMFDVLEHVPSPDRLLTAAGRLLEPGGLLFIHTPNAAVQLIKARVKCLFHGGVKPGRHYLEAQDHVNVYSQKSIKKVLLRNGFDDIVFLHLRPLQIVSGSRAGYKLLLKNCWHYFSVACSALTSNRVNLDNLFVLAVKK